MGTRSGGVALAHRSCSSWPEMSSMQIALCSIFGVHRHGGSTRASTKLKSIIGVQFKFTFRRSRVTFRKLTQTLLFCDLYQAVSTVFDLFDVH